MNRINGDTGASDKGGSSKVIQCKVSETNQNKARATTQMINEAVAENDASIAEFHDDVVVNCEGGLVSNTTGAVL